MERMRPLAAQVGEAQDRPQNPFVQKLDRASLAANSEAVGERVHAEIKAAFEQLRLDFLSLLSAVGGVGVETSTW